MKKVVAGLLIGMAVSTQASVVMTIAESGSDVIVSTQGGSLDLSGLSYDSGSSPANVESHALGTYTDRLYGGFRAGYYDVYSGSISLNKSSGWTDNNTQYSFDSAPTGDGVGCWNIAGILVPTGYVSGNTLEAFSATISNQSFASMGLTENESVSASWSGDSFTLQTIPEPATFGFIGIFGIGALAVRRIFRM